MAEWVAHVRDVNLNHVARVSDYQSLTLVPRFRDVGAWLLDIDATTTAAPYLLQTGAGIDVQRDGVTMLSGPVTTRRRTKTGTSNRLVVGGSDDMLWLIQRLGHPQPTTAAPPYSTQAYDTRTGQCSSVLRQFVDFNAGPSALGVRKVPGLSLAADPALGSTVTGSARWQVLMDLLRELAAAGGDLGFQVQQSGTSLLFSVYQPADRSASVVFSTELGNLAGVEWSEEAAKVNYVYCGGGGVGTARTIQEGQDATSIARWGRAEDFRDRRDTTDPVQLAQSISDELLQNAGPTGLTLTPIDTPQRAFGVDYNLGDKVTVVVDGAVAISDIVREVNITLTPGDSVRITPAVANPGMPGLLPIFDQLRSFGKRIANLERI